VSDDHEHVHLGLLQEILDTLDAIAKQFDPGPVSNASPRAYVAQLDVKGARGQLYGLTGYNAGPAQFLHIYDAADIPAAGTKPEIVLPIAAASAFTLDYGLRGRHFLNGIVIGNSTTDATRTQGLQNLWLDVQYD
jgi:hypothetical protein